MIESASGFPVSRASSIPTVTAAQLAELDERYEANIIEPVNKSGVTDALGRSAIEIDEIRPESDAGRYVQYYYGSGSGEDPLLRRCTTTRRQLVVDS